MEWSTNTARTTARLLCLHTAPPSPAFSIASFLCSWACPLPGFTVWINTGPCSGNSEVDGGCGLGSRWAGCVSGVYFGVVLLWVHHTVFLVSVDCAARLSTQTGWNVLAPDPVGTLAGSQLLGLLRNHTQEGEKWLLSHFKNELLHSQWLLQPDSPS